MAVLNDEDYKKLNNYIKSHGRDEKVQAIEQKIIETNNAEYIYHFAQDVKGADVRALQNAIIKTNSARYMYYFAQDVKGADIKALQEAKKKIDDDNLDDILEKI